MTLSSPSRAPVAPRAEGTPRVAIGLPVYNGERYLAETLADLLGQTFADFVLVIADNASTDGTEAIARAAAERDPRVRYHRNAANIGALPNFNRVFGLAPPTEYFAWAAYDDRHAPDFLERTVALLDADPGAVLAYSCCQMVDEGGAPLAYDPVARAYRAGGVPVYDDRALERDLDGDPAMRFARVLRSNGVNAPIHGVFRREALAHTSLHTFHGSDNLLLAEAALLGRFRCVDAPLFHYRIHAASTLHLTREAWAQRETGDASARARLPLRTLGNYLLAVRSAGALSLGQRLRAYAAVGAYAARADALRRLVVPGIDNYFGVTRWPWQAEPRALHTSRV